MRSAIFILKNERTKTEEDYLYLVKLYKKNNIKIHLIEDFNNEVAFHNLYELLKDLGITLHKECDIISDSQHLIFSSFRVCHEEFANFIYLYSFNSIETYDNYPAEQQVFMKFLVEFMGAKQNNFYKKMFININSLNFRSIFRINPYIINYIDIVYTYDPNNFHIKDTKNKIYYLSQNDNYSIDFAGNSSISIDFNYRQPVCWEIKSESVSKLFAYYSFDYITDKNIEDFKNLITVIKQNNNKHYFERYVTYTADLIERSSLKCRISIQLLTILMENSSQQDFLLEVIIKNINTNRLDVNLWKSLVMYFSLMKFRNLFNFSEIIHKEMKEKNLLVSDMIKGGIGNFFPVYKKGKIVILIDQILSLYHHAPTAVLRALVEMLIEYSEYEVLIISEENFISIKEEYIPNLYFQGNTSKNSIQVFKDSFNNSRVSIYLADDQLPLSLKTQDIVNVVNGYEPEIILSLSTYSTAQNILFEKYPVVNISNGIEYLPSRSHLYLYKNKDRAIDIANKLNDKNLDIREYVYPKMTIPRSKDYSRQTLGLVDEDFIIITIGNRINTEIDPQLIDSMKKLLSRNPKFKWILVGSTPPDYLIRSFDGNLLNQVKHIEYEEDLVALIHICDISLNPNRIGGGYAVRISVTTGVPVAMCDYESDGLMVIGRENALGSNYSELMHNIEKIYADPIYKKNILKRQLRNWKKIDKSGAEKYKELKYFFYEAKKNFDSFNTQV